MDPWTDVVDSSSVELYLSSASHLSDPLTDVDDSSSDSSEELLMSSASHLSFVGPTPPPAQPATVFVLQQHLQALIEGARESWTYAIFWQSSVSSLLSWGGGYWKVEDDKAKAKATASEQDYRKMVRRELINSLIPESSTVSDEVLGEVTDIEWFYLISAPQSFVNGTGLPGQAFVNSTPFWFTGGDRLSASFCDRARQGQLYGLQTLVCIPSENGVLELGSTELIFCNTALLDTMFDFLNRTWLLGHLPLDRLREQIR